MNLKRNIFLVNLYTFCTHTLFLLAIIVPYFQNQLGLTFQQLLIGEAVFAAVIIAMEVPSGWMSDVWSRKLTLIVGCLTAATGYALLLFAQGFWTAMVSQAIVGVGVACNSGTVTSLLYDSLASKGKEHLYQRLEGKRHGTGLYAVATASVVGGIAYGYNPHLPLIFDVTTLVIACFAAFLMVEPERIKREAEKSPLHDMMVTIKYALHGHKEIAGIIIVSTVLFCTTKMFMWTQQPYMQAVGISVAHFGYIIAGGFLFGGLAGHWGHHIKHNLSNRHMIMVLCGLPIVGAGLAMAINAPVGIIFILMVSGVWGYGFPFVQNAINKHADPARRATILSTLGLLISVMFIPTSLIMGWLTEHYSIMEGLGYIAIQLGILSAAGLWLWARGVSEKSVKGLASEA